VAVLTNADVVDNVIELHILVLSAAGRMLPRRAVLKDQ
jgi:hypothetical protein